jgi:hypothetical protein
MEVRAVQHGGEGDFWFHVFTIGREYCLGCRSKRRTLRKSQTSVLQSHFFYQTTRRKGKLNKKFWEELIACFTWYDMDRIENDASNNSSILKSWEQKKSPVLPWLLFLRFFLFPRLKKKPLKLRRHENIEAATMELTAIPQEAFTSCFQDLQTRWQQCIDCGGDYFHGDRNH